MADLEMVVAAIRDRIDYERAYGEHLRLKGRGAERQAFCVFHENTDTPALSVNVEEGIYHCKNPDCGAKGDIFTFLQRVRSQQFVDVVHELARLTGVAHLLQQESPVPAVPAKPLPTEGYVPPETGGVSLADLRASNANGAGGPSANEQAPLAKDPNAPKRAKKDTKEKPPIPEEVVDKYHRALLESPARIKFLTERRGLTEETIVKFKLGHDTARYMIPVRDEQGVVRNIRRYLPDAKKAEDKMYSWREGYGSARLFPLHLLAADEPMFLFEGELDCMLTRQLGLNAYSATGGAGTWKEEWSEYFIGRKVVICYDNDAAGAKGAKKVARALKDFAGEIKVVRIPLAEPKGADITDYIVGHGMGVEDFLQLVEHAPIWFADGEEAPEAMDPTNVHLSEASEAQYYNQPLLFPAMVSGKTTAPFLVPKEVKVGCSPEVRGTMPICERCAVNVANAAVTASFASDDNAVLQMVNVPQASLARIVKTLAGVPSKCTASGYEVLKAMNLEAVQLIPEVVFSDKDTPYVTRLAYYEGHGLQANRSYVMKATTVPEPSKQIVTHLIHVATPAQSNIDAFSLSADVIERLKAFRPTQPGVKGLWQHLGVVYDDLEKVTDIVGRRDLMLAVDLVYHSVLAFRFQRHLLQRGWAEALIIGDSRTGKSTIVQRVMNHYRAGEMTSAENTTAAGLIGGLQQIGTSWILQWGRVPLNDRRFLAIDEVSGMLTEQIGRMSSMRSSGIAEIIKVHTERTNARTRMVWIGNPRNERGMASFGQGVQAVKELIGAPADIARFDLVVTATTDEVPLSEINAPREPSAPETFTSDLCHQRVMWAWSRTSEQVAWAEGSVTEVLRLATEQGRRYRYATEIPLVEPNEQRIKLARLAVATAVCFFSSSDDGETVIVQPEHVQFAAQFLEQLYEKPSLAFADYARQQTRMYSIDDRAKVMKILERTPKAMEMLMEQKLMAQRDLMEILSYDDLKETRMAISTLREAGFLTRYGTTGYVKTPAAILMLRQLLAPTHQSPFDAALDDAATVPSDTEEKPPW